MITITNIPITILYAFCAGAFFCAGWVCGYPAGYIIGLSTSIFRRIIRK